MCRAALPECARAVSCRPGGRSSCQSGRCSGPTWTVILLSRAARRCTHAARAGQTGTGRDAPPRPATTPLAGAGQHTNSAQPRPGATPEWVTGACRAAPRWPHSAPPAPLVVQRAESGMENSGRNRPGPAGRGSDRSVGPVLQLLLT